MICIQGRLTRRHRTLLRSATKGPGRCDMRQQLHLDWLLQRLMLIQNEAYRGVSDPVDVQTFAEELWEQVGIEVLGNKANVAFDMVVEDEPSCNGWLVLASPPQSPFARDAIDLRRGGHGECVLTMALLYVVLGCCEEVVEWFKG